MRHQSSETREEEEDKAGDQDLTKSIRWTECCCTVGCCEGQSEQDALINIRVRQQHRLQKSVSEVRRLRCSVLHF